MRISMAFRTVLAVLELVKKRDVWEAQTVSKGSTTTKFHVDSRLAHVVISGGNGNAGSLQHHAGRPVFAAAGGRGADHGGVRPDSRPDRGRHCRGVDDARWGHSRQA